MYEHTTRNITVFVEPQFLENQSKPDEGQFVWSYTIVVRNAGLETVKLLTRPNTQFQYTSGCPLNTPSGVMQGSYGMINGNGEHFDIAIPAFSLDSPHDKRIVN
jgi:ApaG protein